MSYEPLDPTEEVAEFWFFCGCCGHRWSGEYDMNPGDDTPYEHCPRCDPEGESHKYAGSTGGYRPDPASVAKGE